MDKSIPSQGELLYNGIWNKETDECFIDELIEQKKLGAWKHGDINSNVVFLAMGAVMEKFSITLSYDAALSRRVDMEDRYETFKRVLKTRDIEWDRHSNRVFGYAAIWISLIKGNPYARRYFYQGEPLWDKLVDLFGSKFMGHGPPEDEIINISDETFPGVDLDDQKKSKVHSLVDEDEDEVVSLVAKVQGKAARPPLKFPPPPPKSYFSKATASKNQTSDSCSSCSPVK